MVVSISPRRSSPSLRFARLAGLTALALILGMPKAAVAQELPTLTPSDYGQWESLGGFELDPNGRWLVAGIRRVDGTVQLQLHRADGEGEAILLEHASRPSFSRDGKWMAFHQSVHPDEIEDSKDPIHDRLGLVDLTAARDTVLFEMASFAFRDDGEWLAVRGVSVADSVGADLVLLQPGTPVRTTLGNVDTFAWQDDGPLLAATLKTASGAGNGVLAFDPEAGILRTLDSSDSEYTGLSWREDAGWLAAFRGVEDDTFEEQGHDLLLWTDPLGQPGQMQTLTSLDRSDVPDGMRVSPFAGVEFSGGGGIVFAGLQTWDRVAEEEGEEESAGGAGEETGGGEMAGGAEEDNPPDREDEVEPADVQVWHWNDDDIFRAQEARAAQFSRRTLLAAWHLDRDRLVVLGTNVTEPVQVVAEGRWAVVQDNSDYLFERRFGSGAADWYRVNVDSGERTLLAEGVTEGIEATPDGSHVLIWTGDAWEVVDLDSMDRRTLESGATAAEFGRTLVDYDYPGPRPPWGLSAWMEGGEVALINDRHDVWWADLATGDVVRLTQGAEAGIRYRSLNLDPDHSFFSPEPLDPDAPLWLSAFHLTEKTSGYSRYSERDGVESLVFENAGLGGLARARAAERYVYGAERWEDSPDLFVAGEDLRRPRQITNTNPFQVDFAWGRAELLDYTTDAGHDLQAILVYPAGFEAGETYPLILYQYEQLSDGLHRYRVPSERTYYDFQTWSQLGYFVLMPDIVYEPGRPGPSALDAVEHALDAAVATGHVQADRMGLIGHSWGGYQAAYLPTRTNRFATSVAGAAITDFISFPGTIHWNPGLPEFGHWETGQARMAVPPWEDLEGHLESSPINFIQDLETPVLLMSGDADGVVDFRQSQQYYNYARRAGKNVVMLVYPGADHGLRQETQQVDYHRRIVQWFDHWLKGGEAAKWIVEGEGFQARKKRMGDGG